MHLMQLALQLVILEKWDFFPLVEPLVLMKKNIASLKKRIYKITIKKKIKRKGEIRMKELTYTIVGDYNIPNLVLPEQKEVLLGRWAQMKKDYLKKHHKILYYNLLTKGEITEYLIEVQERAVKLEESIVKQRSLEMGITEELKEADMMQWVQRMNNLRQIAQEMVKEEVIYTLV